jgi:hypothetical protein
MGVFLLLQQEVCLHPKEQVSKAKSVKESKIHFHTMQVSLTIIMQSNFIIKIATETTQS